MTVGDKKRMSLNLNNEQLTQNYTLERLGSKIHHWTTGSDDAPLVVFTHGATLDHHMFDPQLLAVTSAGYRVLAWDMRGSWTFQTHWHGVYRPNSRRRFTGNHRSDGL
jgi:hypothetical protein